MDNVLDHDVLEGEEGEFGPVPEHAGVEAARVVAAEEHRLQVRAAVRCNHRHVSKQIVQPAAPITYGGELLVGGPPVEDLRELGVRPVLVAEDLLEAGGGEHEVAEAVDIGAGLQHHARSVTLHLT